MTCRISNQISSERMGIDQGDIFSGSGLTNLNIEFRMLVIEEMPVVNGKCRNEIDQVTKPEYFPNCLVWRSQKAEE